MRRWIAELVQFGIGKIIFTGGEAFQRYEVLAAGVKVAAAARADVGIFTSSAWATSPERARDTLAGLAGTTHLYLSTDVYHQQRLPLQFVRNAIDAAIEHDIPRISLMITYATAADRDAVSAQYADYGERVEICADRVIPNSKTKNRFLEAQDSLLDLTPSNYSTRCWLATPLLNPNGDFFACHIGKAGAHGDLRKLPHYLGNLREQSFSGLIAAAFRRPDYQFLRTHGPRGVAEMAESKPHLRCGLDRQTFTNGCDMCLSVLKGSAGAEALSEYAEDNIDSIDMRLVLLLEETSMFHSEMKER